MVKGIKGRIPKVIQIGSILLFGSVLAQARHPLTAEVNDELIRDHLLQVEQLRNQAKYEEGLALAQESLQLAESLDAEELVAEALFQISLMYYFLETHEEARAYMEIGLTHSRLNQLTSLEADILNAQGVLEWKQGNLLEATAKLESALAIRQQQNQTTSMASIANNLGIIAYSLQRYEEAVDFYRQGIDWLGDKANDRMRSSLYSNLAESLIPLGAYDEAESYLLKSLAIEEASGEPYSLAYTYYNLGELQSSKGDSEAAMGLFQKALEMQLTIGNEWSASLTRLNIAREYMKGGDPVRALEQLDQGYPAAQKLNAMTLLRDYAGEFARIYRTTGQEGLSRHYGELQQWFASRVEEDKSLNISINFTQSTPLPIVSPHPTGQDLSVVRIAALSLLTGLIIILVFENLRLRRKTSED